MALFWKEASAKIDPADPTPSAQPTAPYPYYGTNLRYARAFGLTQADRPRLFPIVDSVLGPADVTVGAVDPIILSAAVETLALLGMNTLQVMSFGDQTGAGQAVMAAWGITHYRYAVYEPQSWFSWDAFSDAGSVSAWAADIASRITNYLAVPLSGTVVYHLADEPLWIFPLTIEQLLARPAGLTAFRTYLQGLGFVPSDVGGTVWTDVLPIQASAAVSLPTRRLYFHTLRFIAISFAEQQVVNTLALRVAVNPTLLTAVNYNNGPRWHIPSPGVHIAPNPDTGPDAAIGAPDWMEYGRRLPGGVHWTEDWFFNLFSEYWSFKADALRSAAALNGGSWGGYVVGRTLTIGTPAGGRYKALTLLGKGAKVLEWYTFGPEEHFGGNGWSNNQLAYRQIADANRLIARSEDLLWPGQPPAARIAILLPYSSQVWDLRSAPYESPRFLIEVDEVQQALTQRQYPVDYLSEFDVPARLANYDVLYVTALNLSAAAQTTIAAWIAAGGVAYFGPGAAASDEYNTAVTTLDAVKGVTTQIIEREYANQDFNLFTDQIEILDVAVGGQRLATPATDTLYMRKQRLVVTTATVLARFADNHDPAIVAQATGSGWAITSGIYLIHNYGASFNQDPDGLTINWNARLRGMLTLPARLAAAARPVECDQEMVEVARLDSAGGIAVTLLNWSNIPIPTLTVTVHDAPTITRAVLADALAEIAYTQVGATVTVTVPLATADVLKLYT